MNPKSKLHFVGCLMVLIATEATSSLYDAKVFDNFKACFKASMQNLKETDNELALLIDPNLDPRVITAALPPANGSNSVIPTELNEENSIDFGNRDNFTKDSNVSSSMADLALSKSTLKEKIRYLLFTEENQDQFQVMAKNGSVAGTRWRPERKTKVIIHGLTSAVWQDPMTNIWAQHVFEIKDAYLKKSPNTSVYNVILMDWTSLSTVPIIRYPEAAIATQDAGDELADFLIKLRQSNNILNWEDVHLVGHSLGAHVAGVAGLNFRRRGPEYELNRITGLDAAGLCFDTSSETTVDRDSVLDKSDAKFVDIIHTNMGNIVKSIAGRYGSQVQTGHADFYPNGGEVQSGCTFIQDRLNFCSHQKSVIFYANSIWEKTVACPCTSWDVFRSDTKCSCDIKTSGQYMGEYCSNTARGKYFLNM